MISVSVYDQCVCVSVLTAAGCGPGELPATGADRHCGGKARGGRDTIHIISSLKPHR